MISRATKKLLRKFDRLETLDNRSLGDSRKKRDWKKIELFFIFFLGILCLKIFKQQVGP